MRDDLRLVVFFIELPDPLPLPDEAVYTFEMEGPRLPLPAVEVRQIATGPALPLDAGTLVASLRIWQVEVDSITFDEYVEAVDVVLDRALPPHLGRRRDGPDGGADATVGGVEEAFLPGARTVVEAVTPLLPGEDVSDAFDRCLDGVSQLFAAYRLATGDPVPAPTYERLPPVILYATRTASPPVLWDENLSLLLLHTNVPVRAQRLEAPDLERLNNWLSIRKRGHPLFPFAEREVDARVALDTRGDYPVAVVNAQTAVEVLMDAVLTLSLWEEDADPADAATLFSEGLQKRVRTHFSARLGGDWNTRGTGPVGSWGTFLAPLRNRVVHAGYHPARSEARAALAVLDNVAAFVSDRVVERRAVFPRTALLIVGRPGLERRGRWGGEIERFVATHTVREPDWIKAYGAWRDELDEARTGPRRESTPRVG